MHAAQIAARSLPHDGLDRAGVALEILLHLGEHVDARIHAASLDGEGVQLLGELGDHVLAVFELHAAAVEHVLVLARLLRKLRERCVELTDALLVLFDSGAQLLHAALLLGDVALHAFHRLAAALGVCAQHRRGGLHRRALALDGAQALARLLALDILLVHALGDAARGGVEGFELLLRLLQRALRLLVLELDLRVLGVQLVERAHPGGNFAHAQLVAQDEVALGDLRLLLQRADLQLQLVDLVIDAQQVFLGLLELALGLLLPVAEAGDAGGLLKDLAPVGRLVGDDLGDAALPDDRVAVAAEAGVHQKAVDVLEAHVLAVDRILALAAAVVAAGQHDLRRGAVKNMGGVVDDERDLGKAQSAALLGAAENHVLHLRAAQGLGALLAHDPEDRVGDVGFAGAVGSDNGRDVLFKCEAGLVREGLEPLYFQCF